VWFQKKDGTYISGQMMVTIEEDELNGQGTLSGILYTFNAPVIGDLTVDGSWVSGTTSGRFRWEALPDGQFVGSRDTQFGFCGHRQGADKPDPCYLKPPIED
jgi:hypothetical protein